MDFAYGDGVLNSYKPEEHGDCQLICLLTKPTLLISDPDMVQDLFTTKNKIVDKVSSSEWIFRNLLGHSFLLSKTDAVWKAKRQACAHSFYKDQLKIMMEVLKGKIEHYFDIWNKEIESNKSTKIDIR
jgi:cytochrome P450